MKTKNKQIEQNRIEMEEVEDRERPQIMVLNHLKTPAEKTIRVCTLVTATTLAITFEIDRIKRTYFDRTIDPIPQVEVVEENYFPNHNIQTNNIPYTKVEIK